MICADCGCVFDETDQTSSEWEFGQCPGCLSENIYYPEEDGDKFIYKEQE